MKNCGRREGKSKHCEGPGMRAIVVSEETWQAWYSTFCLVHGSPARNTWARRMHGGAGPLAGDRPISTALLAFVFFHSPFAPSFRCVPRNNSSSNILSKKDFAPNVISPCRINP
jgi:hypothetical protein